jgi:hypothetical protein
MIIAIPPWTNACTPGITDLLAVIVSAGAAQTAMVGEYTSITGGLILVDRGRIVRPNLRKEFIIMEGLTACCASRALNTSPG